MKNNNLPIGVFDSGIGGLTVLDKLMDMFPNEDFIYIADTLNLPYGTKPREEIRNIVTDVANYLANYPVKAIVIACNTATSNSDHLKLDIPVIGVIAPTARFALTLSENILVLATNATIDSGKYKEVIDLYKKNKSSNQYYERCSDFVTLVEENKVGTPYAEEVVFNKLSKYQGLNIDTVICGCTHFGLLEREIRNVLPQVKNIIDCAIPTGNKLKEELINPNDSNHLGSVKVLLTKDQDNFNDKIKVFNHDFSNYEIVNIKK